MGPLWVQKARGCRARHKRGDASVAARAPCRTAVWEGFWHSSPVRSEAAKRSFEAQTGYPKGRPGYVVDHIVPLECGGADTPANMQWQTVVVAKDRTSEPAVGEALEPRHRWRLGARVGRNLRGIGCCVRSRLPFCWRFSDCQRRKPYRRPPGSKP